MIVSAIVFFGCGDDLTKEQHLFLEQDNWGEIFENEAEFYSASDVSPEIINLTQKWYEIGTKAWGNYGPLEFWIVGNSVSAAKDLEKKYAVIRREKDSSVPLRAYENRTHGFEQYAKEGNAGLNLRRNEYEEWSGYIITMSAKSPSPAEEDYKPVVLHEYFHVYQAAHIYSRDEEERTSRALKNPWWTEGGAEYMAQLLYSRQEGVRPNYLKEIMSWKLKSIDNLKPGQGIQNIAYGGRETRVAYDLGAWFIAFLINKTSEEAYRIDFFKKLNEKGFEKSFEESFGAPLQSFLNEFHNVFLPSSIEDKLKILPLN